MSGQSGTNLNEPVQVVQLTDADYTIKASQSGCIFLVPAITAARVITLPSPTTLGKYTIIFQAAGNTGVGVTNTVTSTGANIRGVSYGVAAGVVGTNLAGVTSIIRSTTAANAIIGDRIELIGTGSLYYATAISNGVASPWTSA